MARRLSDAMLERARALTLIAAFKLFAWEWKKDPDYIPRANQNSRRINVFLPSGEVRELLITGDKWFNTREKKGGFGAIDLVMHLEELDFPTAVRLINKRLRETIGDKTNVGKEK